jgi:hypothetical protein
MARVVALLFVALTALAACGASSDDAQIKSVIEKLDHEQEDAFAAHDPTIMQDSLTASHFANMVQTNEALQQEGAVGIRLVKLEWGQIDVQSTSAAQAETWETWEETDQDGNTVSTRDRNIYKLLKIGGSWKVDADVYPDKPDQPVDQSGSPMATPSG